MLWRYYHAPDHPARLRIIGFLERLSGNRRILAPVRAGFTMALDKADFVQRTIFAEGEYEPEITRLFEQELNPTDVFYDVGANVGYYACLALHTGVASVCCFEPDPLSASVLKMHLGLNGWPESRCKIFNVALGEREAQQIFYRSHVLNTGMSGFQSRNAISS